MKKRIMSFLLAAVMFFSLLPVTAWAETFPSDGWKALTADGGTLSDGNYYLDGDVTLTNNITFKGVVTLDLNGHVLNGNGNSSVIIVNDANLTLTDSNPDKEHKFTVGGDGLWTLNETDGTETVKGGVITGSTTSYGGGVYVYAGAFTMNGGNIIGNKATGLGGGGVYVNDRTCTFSISGGKIIGNTATNCRGGGVFAGPSSTMVMTGGEIAHNYASGVSNVNVAENGGGGVFTNGSFTMTGGSIHHNKIAATAGSNPGMGGGVYRCRTNFDYGNTTILGGTAQITDNYVGETLSNLYMDKTSDDDDSQKFVTLGTDEKAPTTMRVGVTMRNSEGTGTGTFITNCTATDTKYFFSDNTAYAYKFVDSHLELVAGYAITVDSAITNGSIEVATSAYATETVTVTVTPSSGYQLKADSLKVYKTGDTNTTTDLTPGENNTYTFAMPAYAVTVTAAFEEKPHTHGEGDDGITFTAWTNETSLPTADNLTDSVGSFYLTKDVTLNETWTVPEGTTNLCLNGHVIKYASETNGGVIKIPNGATLNLYDCDTKTKHYFTVGTDGLWTLTDTPTDQTQTVIGGVITGGKAIDGGGVFNYGTFTLKSGTIAGNQASRSGNNTGTGGGLYNATNATTIMEGGVIRGNRAESNGGGVQIYGTFTMTGGEISNNTGNWGGGVEVVGGSSVQILGGKIINNKSTGGGAGINADGALTIANVTITGNNATNKGGGVRIATDGSSIGGDTVISGNLGFENKTQNLYIDPSKKITLADGENAPTSGMSVGVTMESAGQFTTAASGAKDAKDFFTSDNTAYGVNLNNNGTPDDFTDDYLELVTAKTISNDKEQDNATTNNGYISIDKSTAFPSNTVTVTVMPSTGYRLIADSLKAYKTGEPNVTLPLTQGEGSTYTFTMPAYEVTVTAEFEAVPVHSHDGINFTPWEAEDCLPSAAGNYVLTKDVTLAAAWQPVGMTNLCLNGHVIKANGGNFNVITINSGATLNLYDCKTTEHIGYVDVNGLWHIGTGEGTEKKITGGIITGGSSDDGAGVLVKAGGTFNMLGGTVTGNTANKCGGGVNVQGTFNMHDGVIEYNRAIPVASDSFFGGGGVAIYGNGTGTLSGGLIQNNSSTVRGGGVLILYGNDSGTKQVNMSGISIINNTAVTGGGGVYYDNANVTVTLGGDTKITNNVSGGVKNNFHFDRGTTVTLGNGSNGAAAPTTGFCVGVTTQTAPTDGNPVAFTSNGASTDVGYFVPDNADYEVKFDTDHLVLELKTAPAPAPDPYYLPIIIAEITPEPTPEVTPEVTPEITPEPAEEYTVPVESDKDSVQVSAKIEDGIATVDEITEDALEEIIEKKPSGEETGTADATNSITIDLSEAKQDVTGAELTKKSVENLADVVKDKNNNVDSVVIEMKEASVELDAKTLETLHDTMAGDIVKLVVEKTEEKNLNTNQRDALGNYYSLAGTFEAYFESNGEMIHDFNGGTAKVSVEFTPEKGRKAENYKVYYIAEDGKLQKFATKYENGRLTFVTGHFSDYVIIYDNIKDVLLAEAATTKKGYIKLSWNEIGDAVKYVVYGAKCGKSYKELAELDAETDGNSFIIKKISGAKPVSGKTYKFYVVAYDALGNRIKSKSIHYIAGDTSAKYANVETITALQKTLELTVGEKATVGAEYTMYEDKKHTPEKHGKALRFTSDCPEVAKVAKDGTVTAKSEGKAVIYIQDISGKWCQVEVTVKEK